MQRKQQLTPEMIRARDQNINHAIDTYRNALSSLSKLYLQLKELNSDTSVLKNVLKSDGAELGVAAIEAKIAEYQKQYEKLRNNINTKFNCLKDTPWQSTTPEMMYAIPAEVKEIVRDTDISVEQGKAEINSIKASIPDKEKEFNRLLNICDKRIKYCQGLFSEEEVNLEELDSDDERDDVVESTASEHSSEHRSRTPSTGSEGSSELDVRIPSPSTIKVSQLKTSHVNQAEEKNKSELEKQKQPSSSDKPENGGGCCIIM